MYVYVVAVDPYGVNAKPQFSKLCDTTTAPFGAILYTASVNLSVFPALLNVIV